MKIIVNQNKELRAVGYDESVGCNLLETDFYIAKSLNPHKPLHCVIDDRYHLLLQENGENENYIIYKIFDLINISLNEGIKILKFSFNNIETESIQLLFPSFKRDTLSNFLKGGR